MSTPPPAPLPTPEMSMATPAPVQQPPHETPKPHPQEQRHTRRTTSTTVGTPGTSTANTNPNATHGAPGGGNGPIGAHARYRSNPKPDYPPASLERHEEGLVVLGVDVSADGHASNVSLKRSSGYPALDEAAITGVRRWTFEPARAAGFAVSSHVDVPVRFSLSDYRQ
jgi:protein TonB